MAYTITVGQPKDSYTGVPIETWSVEALVSEDGSTYEPVTVTDNAFEIEAGWRYTLSFTATGYRPITVMGAGSRDDYRDASMVPIDYKWGVFLYCTTGSNQVKCYFTEAKLYKQVNDTWTLIEECVGPGTGDRPYFNTTLDYSSTYKVSIIATDSYHDYDDIIWTTTDSDNSYPTQNYIYTWSCSYKAIDVTVCDSDTGDEITDATVSVQRKVGYRDYSEITKSTRVEKYLLSASSGSTCLYKVTVTKAGYTTYSEETTYIGNNTKNLDKVIPVTVSLVRTPVFTLNVTDSETGDTVTGYTATVSRNGTIKETSTDGRFFEPWDGEEYTLTITKQGYDTYEHDYVDYPDSVAITTTTLYSRLYVSVYARGSVLSGATVTVTDNLGNEIAETDGHYPVIYNKSKTYTVTVEHPKYYTYESDTIAPSTDSDITLEAVLEKIPVYAPLYVIVTDQDTGDGIDADISVYDVTAEEYIEPTGIFWKLLAEEDHIYKVTVAAEDYYGYESDTFPAENTDPIYLSVALEHEPIYAPLTVAVKDVDTGEDITDASITVRCETTQETIEPEDGIYYLLVDELYYKVYVSKKGYTSQESEVFEPEDEAAIYKILFLEPKLVPYASADDVKNRTGVSYTAAQLERIEYLLEDVSNLIRYEGKKCGVDVDAKVAEDKVYASIVKTVTCDVVARYLRQSQEGDVMSQESQSALGYTWSGTYAIPGGGIAMSLMRNEKDILGFDSQTIGVIDLC